MMIYHSLLHISSRLKDMSSQCGSNIGVMGYKARCIERMLQII